MTLKHLKQDFPIGSVHGLEEQPGLLRLCEVVGYSRFLECVRVLRTGSKTPITVHVDKLKEVRS